jgi:tRNA pseudouridine55 synthase
MSSEPSDEFYGVLLVDKPKGKTSFHLVARLRRLTGVKTIGHAGTLDPFATGVMVLLIGKPFTRLSDRLLTADKEYLAELHLGITTDSFDCDGEIQERSDNIPSLEEIKECLKSFQGEVDQTPPMFSAKKVNGKKLYELARQGKVIERKSVKVQLETTLLSYQYPYLTLNVKCSKGTYIRSISYDLGLMLGCGAHLSNLRRLRSGSFKIEDCFDGHVLQQDSVSMESIKDALIKNPLSE